MAGPEQSSVTEDEHALALDGVYVRDNASGRLVFHALGTPTRAEVAASPRAPRRASRQS